MAKGGANEIIIRFKTIALEKAKKLTEDIEKKIKAAGRNIKDVATRNKFVGKASVLAEERLQEIRQLDHSIRAKRLAEQDGANFGQRARQGIGQAREKAGKLGQALGIAQSGDLTSGLTLLAGIPGLGQVAAAAAIAAAAARIVLPILQKEIDQKNKAMENRLALRQQRAFLEADPARRFAEDPDFRDKQTRRAVMDQLARDRAARAGGWRRRGAFTVPE